MDREELAPHVDDIARALGNMIEREDLENELDNYVNVYRVALDTAKRSIIKKYGGNPADLKLAVTKKLEDMLPNEGSVNFLCKVLSVNPKTITQGGEERTIFYGLMGDETKTLQFTAWEDLDIKKGEVVQVENAYTKEWREEPQINLGTRVRITKIDAEIRDIPPFTTGFGSVEKKLSELGPSEGSVSITAKILTLNSKVVNQDDDEKTIYYGFLGDETASHSFTAWDDFGLEDGKVYEIKNVYTREWQGKIQVNLGSRTEVVGSDRAIEKIPSFSGGAVEEVSVSELKEGMGRVAVTARILGTETRDVTVEDTPKKVYSGILGDGTGKIQFSAWSDFHLKENEVVRISGGYIKTWRGIPQLSFDESAEVGRVDDTDFPGREEIDRAALVTIGELSERGGAVGAKVKGIVIDLKNGSGLIFRCPECRRVIKKGSCRIHGQVSGVPDLRAKAVLDDGTGAMTSIFGKDITEKFLGKSLDQCIEEARNAMNNDIIQDELSAVLLARLVDANGNVTSDDFGLMMIAEEVRFSGLDVEESARKLLDEVGGLE